MSIELTALVGEQNHSCPAASLTPEQRTKHSHQYDQLSARCSPLFTDWLKARLPVDACSTQSGFENATMERCGPLLKHAQDMKEGLLNPLNPIVLFRAPTGSGKTLAMPELLLFAHGNPETFKVLIIQPQRILVTSTYDSLQLIRNRLRSGYCIGKRRNSRKNMTLGKGRRLPHCLITVASIGARLLKLAVDNPDPEHALDVVVIDEAHIRSVHTNALIDSAVALLHAGKLKQLVFTSATIPGLNDLKARLTDISGLPVRDDYFTSKQPFQKSRITFDKLYARFHYAQLAENGGRCGSRDAANEWMERQLEAYHTELRNDRKLSVNEKIARFDAAQTGDLSQSAHFVRLYKNAIDRSPCDMLPAELYLRVRVILEDIFARIATAGVLNHPHKCVLILADGLSEMLGIEVLTKNLLRQKRLAGDFFKLHSTLPEPDNVQAPPDANKIKIVLTANSGQQGMTFSNLGFIVDLGRSKIPEPRDAECMYSLTSRLSDSATREQREGRGGRTCDTRIYYPFGEGILGEMERQPGLSVKAMINSVGPDEIACWAAEGRRVIDLTSARKMVDPVPAATIDTAITEGIRMGVFVSNAREVIRQSRGDDRAMLTGIGSAFASIGAARGLSLRLQKIMVAAAAVGILSVAVRAVAACEFGASLPIRAPKSGGKGGKGGRDDDHFGLNNRHIVVPNEEHYAIACFMKWAENFDRSRLPSDHRNSEADNAKLEAVNWNGVDEALRIIDECEVVARSFHLIPSGASIHSSEHLANRNIVAKDEAFVRDALKFALAAGSGDHIVKRMDADRKRTVYTGRIYPESLSRSTEEYAVYVHGRNVSQKKKIALITELSFWQVVQAANLFGPTSVRSSMEGLTTDRSDDDLCSDRPRPSSSLDSALEEMSLSSSSSGGGRMQSQMLIASNTFKRRGDLLINIDASLPDADESVIAKASDALLHIRSEMETQISQLLNQRFVDSEELSTRLEHDRLAFFQWMDEEFIKKLFASTH